MNHEQVINQVLKPTVRIRTAKATGSGTVIKTEPYKDKLGGTWILTNHHVISSCITIKEVWDELLKKKVDKEFVDQVEIDLHRLDATGRVQGLTTASARVQLSNERQDLALLRIEDPEPNYPVAHLYPEPAADSIPMLVQLLCCGAALGEKPIVTQGFLNGQQIEIENFDYCLSSAPSIFGNSGGAVYTQCSVKDDVVTHDCDAGDWYYIGMPSRIAVSAMMFSVDAITHMGYFIPIRRVYAWLRDNCFEFLWDSTVSEAECNERREQKRQEELSILAFRKRG